VVVAVQAVVVVDMAAAQAAVERAARAAAVPETAAVAAVAVGVATVKQRSLKLSPV
jgi:hypothetical protein